MTMPRSLVPCALLVSCTIGSSWTWQHAQADRTLENEIAITAGDALELRSDYGFIEVRTTAENPRLEAILHAIAPTKEEAQQILGQCNVALRRDGQRVIVELQGPSLPANHSVTASYRATVPEGVAVQADAGVGNITVRGRTGSCSLHTDYGEVRVEGARGAVTAESGTGDVGVASIVAPSVILETRYGTITAHDLQTEQLTCRTGTGGIEVDRVMPGRMRLRSGYGDIEVRDASGELEVATETGAIRIDDCEGVVSARSGYGTVRIEGAFRALTAQTDTGDVNVTAREGSACRSDWEIRSGYGDLTVRLPHDLGARIDAQTDYGDVDSELPLTSARMNRNAMEGSLGTGSGVVRLRTDTGRIVLRSL